MIKISELKKFDSVKAAQDPLVQEELLKLALEDGDIQALIHALSVIAKSRRIGDRHYEQSHKGN